MRAAGYAAGNVDVTVICERPKLGERRERDAGRRLPNASDVRWTAST